MQDSVELLCVFLRVATQRNVSPEHMEALKAEYDPEGPRSTESRESKGTDPRWRVFWQLEDFTARAFKQNPQKEEARAKKGRKAP